MSGNISTTGSIEVALDNLEETKLSEANEDSDCPNCAKPRAKRKVTKKNVKSGTCYGQATEAVDLVPVCPDCGQVYERLRSDGDHSQEPKHNSRRPIHGKYRKSKSGTFHLLDGNDLTICGYRGGKIVEEKAHNSRICGDCQAGRRRH